MTTIPTPRNQITTLAYGARHSSGIMASASGHQTASRYAFDAGRTHSIFSGPLRFRTRLQSSRQSLTAEPNADIPWRHAGTQTGITMVAPAPDYPSPSPMMLGQPAMGGAQSQFGITTVRGAIQPPSMMLLPIVQRKTVAAGRAAGI